MSKTPFSDPFFAQIPGETLQTFTPEQLEAIKYAFSPRPWKTHPVDIRLTLPIPGCRFYLVLLGGRESRSPQRRRAERSQFPLWTPANIVLITAFLSLFITSGYATVSVFFASLKPFSLPTTAYPTSLPWITNSEQCEKTNRTWSEGQCWDSEHNPLF
ncbi:MAG: hypothetical protein RIE73_13685 [Coleofasciculus sp. C1-SOL-03]|jgi:hypothetical protein|uniref:hypothetical protein n=1 Tax=Coleofasciculus sp. C1-SOL-03 TaxID=3069522 RepID=UPI0032F195BD